MQIVAEFLSVDTDKGIHLFFRRLYAEELCEAHRTSFSRQAANLWKMKEQLWREFLGLTPHAPAFALVDSMPLPACLFARAYRCRRFPGEAAAAIRIRCTGKPSTASGYMPCKGGLLARRHPPLLGGPSRRPRAFAHPRTPRVHPRARRRWRPQLSIAQDQRTAGEGPGRRTPCALPKQEEARSRSQKERVVEPRTLPDRHRLQPAHRKVLREEGLGQRPLALLVGRLLRKVLSHTVAFLLNHRAGNRPLQLARLLR